MKSIVLIGAGGHCKAVIDLIKSTNDYEIVGITDNHAEREHVLDVPVIGDDSRLTQIYASGVHQAFICIGALNQMTLRSTIYKNLKRIGFKLPVLVHKHSVVSPYARIEEGTCIMPGAVVNAGASIGENCIVNSLAIVEHDCYLNHNVHISSNAALAGGVQVGSHSLIGIGSSVIQGLTIGERVTIGAGAAVVRNVPDDAVAVGVPARIIKYKKV